MKTKSPLISLMIASLLASNFAVGSEGGLPPIKRLGRGIGDRKTGESLQLACVGAVKEGASEQGCEKLRFLHADESGREALMGPTIDLSDVEENSSRKIREELQCYGLFRNIQTGRFFMVSRKLLPVGEERRKRCLRREYSTLDDVAWRKKRDAFYEKEEKKSPFSVIIPLSIWGFMGYLGVTGAMSVGGAFLLVPATYATGFAIDGVTYPFRLFFDKGVGPLGIRTGNVAVLESRAKTAWQLKPKNMAHDRFQKVVERLREIDDFRMRQEEQDQSFLENTPMSHPDEWLDVTDEGVPSVS